MIQTRGLGLRADNMSVENQPVCMPKTAAERAIKNDRRDQKEI